MGGWAGEEVKVLGKERPGHQIPKWAVVLSRGLQAWPGRGVLAVTLWVVSDLASPPSQPPCSQISTLGARTTHRGVVGE